MAAEDEIREVIVIALTECKRGYLYQIRSRNLGYGVFDGKTGFIGIREKFDSKYLFTEYHHDSGAPFGTVQPEKELEPVPEGTDLREHYPDLYCGTCEFTTPWVVESGDSDERPSIKHRRENPGHQVYVRTYTPLFDWLTEREARYDALRTCLNCNHHETWHGTEGCFHRETGVAPCECKELKLP